MSSIENASQILLNNITKNSGGVVDSSASLCITCAVATILFAFLWWDAAFVREPRRYQLSSDFTNKNK
jgi:hypothetical protein